MREICEWAFAKKPDATAVQKYLQMASGIAVLSFFLGSGAALAQSPQKLSASETVLIAATPDKTWSIMGNFQDVSWCSRIAQVSGEKGNIPNEAKRTVTLPNGGSYEEALKAYDAAKMTYTYVIGHVDPTILPVDNFTGQILVTPDQGGQQSTVEWRATFVLALPKKDPPPLTNEDAIKAVSKLFNGCLSALKTRVETGK